MVKKKYTFIDLFAGIGGIRLGFESVGGHCVFSSEFDEDACKTYEANFHEHPAGDITKIDAKDIPDFDILLGGFPCQAFSIIGKKEGFANETCGTLFFEIERILKEKRPKAFLLENVKNLKSHDDGNTYKVIKSHLLNLGYNVYESVLNSLDYGVPQKRERIFIVGFLNNVRFSFPQPVPINQRKNLSDILEKNVDKKYYVKTKEAMKENTAEIFSKPMNLGDFITEPCIFEKISDNEAYLTIHEGKFHQVKRMFQYAGSEVETLIRTDFAFLNLNGLDTGEYRHLTEEEITKLKKLTDEKR